MVGGLSARYARAFSQDMRSDPEYLLSMVKDQEKKQTRFACFVKNLTEQPLTLTIPLGTYSSHPILTPDETAILRAQNRSRVCNLDGEQDSPPPESNGRDDPDEPEFL